MTKVLSDSELKDKAYKILGSPFKNVDPEDAAAIVALVNEQKLAHADYVIGEDELNPSKAKYLKTGYLNDLQRSTAIDSRNGLREQQRQRNNLNATSGDNDEKANQ